MNKWTIWISAWYMQIIQANDWCSLRECTTGVHSKVQYGHTFSKNSDCSCKPWSCLRNLYTEYFKVQVRTIDDANRWNWRRIFVTMQLTLVNNYSDKPSTNMIKRKRKYIEQWCNVNIYYIYYKLFFWY